ncbi:hypothetical protein [Noviherbaspirillum galbum]|uniref:Uncharacterized protein n=1 Tax=Noviherbaspirillum galbum TaxID=2709383 RepID=A0A6B3SYH5_9BURK|nr:hypothetical protein [Noviherbaspirillum galbum]NEX63029.1 hypothetical protein [Noviherbaspirillum galbum]
MSGPAGFRYALEPLLRQRDWECQQLSADLAVVTTAIAALQSRVDGIDGDMLAASDNARQDAVAGALPCASRLVIASRYLRELSARRGRVAAELKESECNRDRLIEQILALRKALDRLKQHKQEAADRFAASLQSREMRDADDHWLVLSKYKESADERH